MKRLRLLDLVVFFPVLAGSLWLAAIGVIGIASAPSRAQIGVIFGTAVLDDGTPRAALRERLQAGLALWRSGDVPRLMVSGAVEARNHRDEARIMAAWLQARGVPASDIVVDSTGNTTWATACHVATLHVTSAVVVTQWFHIARSRWALRRNGIDAVSGVWPRHFRWVELWYLGREGAALVVYGLTKHPPH